MSLRPERLAKERRAKAERLDFATLDQAVQLLLPHVDSQVEAKEAIADGMLSGVVTTLAEVHWRTTLDQLYGDWMPIKKAAPDYRENWVMVRDFFRQSRQWPAELRHWKWDTSQIVIFLSEEDAGRQERLFASGVRVKKADVLALVGKTVRSGVGRPLQKREWRIFWHAVISLALDGKLKSFSSSEKLRKHILLETHDELNEDTIKDEVQRLWKTFIESRG